MGQKFAAYDAGGKIICTCDSVLSPVPEGMTAIEITDEEWRAHIDAQSSGQAYTVDVVKKVLIAPTPFTKDQLLESTKQGQKIVIDNAFIQALQQPLDFTTAGKVTKSFQADDVSTVSIVTAAQAYTVLGSVPDGFFWKAADNTQVPFTLKDIQGLLATVTQRNWDAFQKRTELKAQIDATKTSADAMEVAWK